jgi:hypothetical protein
MLCGRLLATLKGFCEKVKGKEKNKERLDKKDKKDKKIGG